ncbi:MAG: hypothetical protein NT008_03625 [Methylococcales bacterium]|nr:hypothetical protein [Methylococcales bacterium]
MSSSYKSIGTYVGFLFDSLAINSMLYYNIMTTPIEDDDVQKIVITGRLY